MAAPVTRKFCVSIHAPAGGATPSTLRVCSRSSFQFTLPRGERRADNALGFGGRWFQFTLPRGERQKDHDNRQSWPTVSIHAPAGGATGLDAAPVAELRFNSRSRGGSDSSTRSPPTARWWFQFTLPRGERLVFVLELVAEVDVSIHAPAGGATDEPGDEVARPRSFNSRSRGGSDIASPPSTARRPWRFNSRSRGGSDWVGIRRVKDTDYSAFRADYNIS